MKFEVYCDESHPDAFTSTCTHAQYLMIGSLWLPSDLRQEIKIQIKQIKAQNQFNNEIKWHKVHQAKENFNRLNF